MAGAPRKSLEPFLKDDVQYFPHQTEGIRWAARQSSFILADDMGLGKSLQALTVFCIDCKMGKSETLLIVCPVTLRDNWADEIQKFTRIPFTLLGEVPHPTRRGEIKKLNPKQRHEQLVEFTKQVGPRILVCNYEQLSNPVHADLLRTFRFDMGIWDEAHTIKNPKAKRTQASHSIRARRSGMLTGTPMLNHVDELWSLLHRIDPHRWPSYWKFVNRYCVFGGYENRQVVGVKNEAELRAILSEVMIRRLKNDVLDREKPTYIQHKVGLSDYQRKLYDQIEEELWLQDGHGNEMDVDNALTKFLRLKQVCNTPYSIDPSFDDDSLKLDRMEEIAAELANRDEKLVMFTQFRGTLQAMTNRLAKMGVGPMYSLHGDVGQKERQPIVKRWGEEPGSSFILCMTQVAGVGLNMVQASECMFIDKLFVPGLNKQAVDRLDRIGQTKPVMVHELITRRTIESRIESILKSKELLNEDIVEGGVGMKKLMDMLKEKMKNDLS